MTNQDRIFALEEAQEKMREALGLIKEATKGTSAAGTSRAYVESNLATLIDEHHGYLDNSTNVQDLINTLEEQGDE